jgi:methyltransferase
MMNSRSVYFVLLAALAVERLYELWLSKRKAQRMFARGAIEVARGQYRVMVLFHALFIVGCAAEASLRSSHVPVALSVAALIGEAAAQALRYWSVATLGENWNTRVIVIPNAVPITSGPYRYLRHPNYAAVATEIACVPLVRGLWVTALIFSAVNALLLRARVRTEEYALGERYESVFKGRPRFFLPASAADLPCPHQESGKDFTGYDPVSHQRVRVIFGQGRHLEAGLQYLPIQ